MALVDIYLLANIFYTDYAIEVLNIIFEMQQIRFSFLIDKG